MPKKSPHDDRRTQLFRGVNYQLKFLLIRNRLALVLNEPKMDKMNTRTKIKMDIWNSIYISLQYKKYNLMFFFPTILDVYKLDKIIT